MPDAVSMQDVIFGYERGKPVLHVHDLRVEEGRKIFLYGPSGSGKTTLLGLIAGILQPQQGTCQVVGQEMTRLSTSARDELRGSDIGYIFQSFNLIPYLSVRQNIELPCRVHKRRRERIVASTLDREAVRIAHRLGIGTALDNSVQKLSTGQQQRVAIARAVMGRPRLVIADEPTSSLDTDRRDSFLELLFEVCDESNATLIFVSHDRSLMSRFDHHLSITDERHFHYAGSVQA